jgi:hypothetical protein
MLVSCLTYSLAVKVEIDFQQTTWRYIPQGGTLHNRVCENRKSYIPFFSCIPYTSALKMGQHVRLKHWYISAEVHIVISQKRVSLILIYVRISGRNTIFIFNSLYNLSLYL